MSAASSYSSMPKSVCEGLELSEANKILLMALMEETQEDQYYADDRLMSMIHSLEAEISSTSSTSDPYQSYDITDEVGEMDDQNCSTSSVSFSTDNWEDMEVVSAASPSSSTSSSSFDEEMMNAWSLSAAGGDDSGDYSSEFYHGVVSENYFPMEASGVVF